MLKETQVLLVKRRYAPRAGAWCLPAGFMEYGETPRHCAKRELKEETGLSGRIGELFGVYAGQDDPRVHAILILYRVTAARGTLVPGDDAIDARFFPLDSLPKAIAFAAHRQALDELRVRISTGETHAPPRRNPPRGSARSGATPPRPARAARPRSRRA